MCMYPSTFFAYCCRGILLIFFYYNVRRMFVALRICACIMQFAFEFNASAFYHLCMYYSFEFNASAFYHLCMYYPPFSLHLYIIYHHVNHNIIHIIPFLFTEHESCVHFLLPFLLPLHDNSSVRLVTQIASSSSP